MSTPAAGGTVHPFKVCVLNSDDTRGVEIGGSYDNISAVTIACCLYSARQAVGGSISFRVAVYDDSGTGIAVVGQPPGAPTQTAPVPPTLSSLQPDSSGNWSTEVVLTGTNFTQTSEVLANGSPVTPVTYVSATELRVVVPASAAGPYTVKVKNGSAESNALTFTAL